MKTKTKYTAYNTGPGGFVIQGENVQVHLGEKRKPKMEYPAGSIGADLVRRNYIRYLTERYFRYREADASFGSKAVRRFSYAVLFKSIRDCAFHTGIAVDERVTEQIESAECPIPHTSSTKTGEFPCGNFAEMPTSISRITSKEQL